MFIKFLKLLLSKPFLTLRLAHPRRIKHALLSVMQNRGNLSQLYKRYQEIYSDSDSEQQHVHLMEQARFIPDKGDIFLFPIIDWSFRHQRPQHLALNLASLGYRVIYFSTTPLVNNSERSYCLVEQTAKGVFVCRLRADGSRIDDIHRDAMSAATRDAYQRALIELMSDLDVVSPVLLLNHPYWFPLAALFPEYTIGYDCMDHHAAFHDAVYEGIPDDEEKLIRNANFVVTSSDYLSDKISRIRANTIVRNGCDYDLFSQIPCWSPTDRRVAGYVGAIAEWFDIELVFEVSERLPHWQFVLVGSTVGCDVRAAKKRPNIEFVGEVTYDAVPGYIACFDVCMIPFKLTELTKATNPVKVYEYLAAGRAVVSTPLPEVVSLGDKVSIAGDAGSFASMLESSRRSMCESDLVDDWKGWAAQQDWLNRARHFEHAMVESMGED